MRKLLILWPVSLSLLVTPMGAQNQQGFTPAAQPSNSTAAERAENRDPLLDLPPLPRSRITLVGGTVVSLDEVMNRMVIQPFGTKQKMRVAFDTRTQFYRDRKPISYREIKQGQRIYLDSMLNGSTVFAKQIWIQTSTESGLGGGQIIDFDSGRQILTVRDELSNQPIKMHLTTSTVVRRGEQPASTSDLVQGALVSLTFGTQQEIREITVLASPGSSFTFAGRVTYLDMSRKLIAIDNVSDHNRYDVSIAAIPPSVMQQLHEGSEVSISAVFDGSGYEARRIQLPGTSSAEPQ
jgi:hypothetical protein